MASVRAAGGDDLAAEGRGGGEARRRRDAAANGRGGRETWRPRDVAAGRRGGGEARRRGGDEVERPLR
jgi:hypothetical protein